MEYDYELLKLIWNNSVHGMPLKREPYQELESVILNKKGICNAISQYYKLLLEKVGIYSMCVICDDKTEVKHQLNLVYNEDTGNYSFDDITSVIVKRGRKSDCFDYDLITANRLNQGTKNILGEEAWVILPEDYIDFLSGRENFPIKRQISKLPDNIVSTSEKGKGK